MLARAAELLALNRSIAGILLIRLSGRISYGLISVNNLIWCL